MTMHTAPSDRDYSEYLNPPEQDPEEPQPPQLAKPELTQEVSDAECPF